MDKLKIIKSETEALLEKMVDKFEVSVKEETGIYEILIKADQEAPIIIGRHGETIRAVQKILEVIFYKKFGEAVEILVNINDYREKQKERLENLAEQFAQKAIQSKGPVFLKNFSSYERKIIHEYIAKNYSQLTSYSQGEGKERQLVIEEKK
ncbi:MAG: KH domain-containing protein [Patescibacteria group bacterium]|nr:KH domain-containing protein [Patescibacteria group bacterium]